jgi:hypothetical protein
MLNIAIFEGLMMRMIILGKHASLRALIALYF